MARRVGQTVVDIGEGFARLPAAGRVGVVGGHVVNLSYLVPL